jgi:hypothetical protein
MMMSYNKDVAGDNNATNACTGLKDCIKEMCRCMRKEQPVEHRTWLYKMLHSWYMPRNERDVMCYMKRYRVWRMLPTLLMKRIVGREVNNEKN